ncbi:MAG: RNA 2'-phosphotransferase [Desulfatiglandales bacterium]
MSRKAQIKVEKLARFLVYILGHRPDEFGLVPDADGFVAFKELLQAIHEEPGWGYVRQANLNEILLGKDGALFEVDEKRIRTLDQRWDLDVERPSASLPKLLYVAVRRRAHPHALDTGLKSAKDAYLILSSQKNMALRIGQRKDATPVLLEVTAERARAEGLSFYSFGQLYLSNEIPPRHIKGPPLPKEAAQPPAKGKEKETKSASEFHPGTFVLEVGRDPAPQRHRKVKKERGWKEEARKMRRKGSRTPP